MSGSPPAADTRLTAQEGVAANAIIAAMLDALDVEYDELEAVQPAPAPRSGRGSRSPGRSMMHAPPGSEASSLPTIRLTPYSPDTMPDDVVVFLHVPERQIRKSALPGNACGARHRRCRVRSGGEGRLLQGPSPSTACATRRLGLDTDIAVRALQNGIGCRPHRQRTGHRHAGGAVGGRRLSARWMGAR